MTDDPFGPAAAGRDVKLAEYFTALEARSAAISAWEAFFDEWDVLLSPTVNRTAFEHRPAETPFDVDGVETEYWSVGRHTQPMNFFGAPAIALPAGAGPDGLPLSIQLSARRWADDRLLAIAAAVELLAGGFRPPPPPFGG
jgi:amidase